jgi:glutathione S-transferase
MRLYDYAASGNCYKARLLLALLGEPYERVPIDIFAGETLTDEFAAINPARETPVLVLEDGTVITQSNAILWYLAEQSPLLPGTRAARAQVLQWLMFELEYIVRGVATARFWRMTGRAESQAIAARVEQGRDGLERLDKHLRESDYLVESLSIADIGVFAYAHVADDAGIALDEFPHVSAWCRRIKEEPRFVDDFIPYPPNARPGAGRSIYD